MSAASPSAAALCGGGRKWAVRAQWRRCLARRRQPRGSSAKLEDTAPRSSIAAPPPNYHHQFHMSSPLLDVWEAASSSPYQPTVGKGSQFTVGFLLLLIGKSRVSVCCSRVLTCPAFLLAGVFSLSMPPLPIPRDAPANVSRSLPCQPARPRNTRLAGFWVRRCACTRCTAWHILITGSFGAVYMICAVGVYV